MYKSDITIINELDYTIINKMDKTDKTYVMQYTSAL